MRYLITLYANYKLAKIENLKRGRLGYYTLYILAASAYIVSDRYLYENTLVLTPFYVIYL